MADNSMPPMPPAAPAMAGGQPPAGGDVNVTMPKAAFDALHQMVVQLAQVLDALKQDVDKQAGGGEPTAPGQPPAGGPPEGGPSDDDFLKGMAAEGSAR